jgi:glycosyltransferase involved in cell wall biosynthesis
LSTKKLRILVLAEAANPDWTSVPLIGWLHTKALANQCDVHLVTNARNREAIENAGWVEGEQFTTIDTEKIAAPIYHLTGMLRGGRSLAWTIDTAMGSLVYPYFEWKAWRHFKAALKNGEYDLVHRITPVTPTSASIIAKRLAKIDVPFVVGPLNGGVPWPKEFQDLSRKEKEWLNKVRDFYKLLPGYRSMRRCASAILVGSLATKEQMKVDKPEKVFYLAENAVDKSRFNITNSSSYQLPIKAAFVGRLVPYKGADMAIEAMLPFLTAGTMTFDIFGDGPEMPSIKRLVETHKLEHAVTLHGFVNNSELQAGLAKSDILAFPSVREFGGGVVLESMAVGVVPVVANYAGPAELVTNESGYLVEMGNRQRLIENFRNTLQAILDAPEQLVSKREAAMHRIDEHFTWEKKIEREIEIYRSILMG